MHRHARTVLAAAALAASVAAAPAGSAAADGPDALPSSGKGKYLGSWSLSASAGYAMPSGDRYRDDPTWRLAAGYSPVPRLGFELEYGRFTSDVGGGGGPVPDRDLADGTLDVRGVSLSAVLRHPLAGVPAAVHLLGGVGGYRVSYRVGDEARRLYEASGVMGLPDQKVENAWGVHAGIGAEYVLGANLSLVAEARYLFLSPAASGNTTPGNRLDDSIDLGTLVLTGGVKAGF